MWFKEGSGGAVDFVFDRPTSRTVFAVGWQTRCVFSFKR
jgi:hypothetical protein